MRLSLLVECVNVLSQCDVDDPKDQKTIAVCENYILASYEAYKESCDNLGYEPLNVNEYFEELFLNELFDGLKEKIKDVGSKIAAPAAGLGLLAGGAALAKTKRTIDAYSDGRAQGIKGYMKYGKALYKQAGGKFKNFAGIVKDTSGDRDEAVQQFKGATKTTQVSTDADGNVVKTRGLELASREDARRAIENGETLQGKKVVERGQADQSPTQQQGSDQTTNQTPTQQQGSDQTTNQTPTQQQGSDQTPTQQQGSDQTPTPTDTNTKPTTPVTPTTTDNTPKPTTPVTPPVTPKPTTPVNPPVKTEALNIVRESYNAATRTQPLTGAIRFPSRIE